MLLQHIATYDIPELLEIAQANSIKEFIRNINKFAARQDPDIYDPLKYKGDVFETFAEWFFKFFNGDHILTYTTDYEPNTEYDRGIDGRGVSTLDGKPNVIQIKFSSDPTKWLTNEQNISNVAADACLNEGLQPNGKNIIVFTSGKGVHPKHPMANVHTISLKEIKRYTDGNVRFWDDFRAVIKDTTQAIHG